MVGVSGERVWPAAQEAVSQDRPARLHEHGEERLFASVGFPHTHPQRRAFHVAPR